MNKKLCKCSGSWASSFLIKSTLPFAISIPVFVSSSCGMFYRTYNERELSIYLNTDIFESKIRKIIDNRIQVFSLGDKWVLEYSPEVKEKIGEFLKLISSFTYAPNYEFPGIENEYISYLYYTGENRYLFYSNEIEESKIAKEYDSKNVHKTLTLDNLSYFDGIKYAKELSMRESAIKNNADNNCWQNLSYLMLNDIHKNLLKLYSRLNQYIDTIDYSVKPDDKAIINAGKNIKVENNAFNVYNDKKNLELLATINNYSVINKYRKFGVFDVKKETLIIDSKNINALTFKFNNTYSINDISVNAIKYNSGSEAPVNDISINFSYRHKLMSFKEFINFKKRTSFSSKNLSKDKISYGFVDLDELFKNISGIDPSKPIVLSIETSDFGKPLELRKFNRPYDEFFDWESYINKLNIFIDYLGLLNQDTKTMNTQLLLTPDSWNLNNVSEQDWKNLLHIMQENI
ncbi:hypothetical protein MBOVJF4428_00480 [Mycoplasmopsis agalactiae]|nr:hypothetical protein [Mycoplasmopsis agalactiae]MCE6056964.1 hypothetical protein [Mycoplasmopsis agalactiae]MCE6078749.1 hypothetical protein [Mycoplasmopsis agalactiae]MCE6095135.1 hypothetical protein [Mycoplasmopsis agalactiae]SBO45446.1 hypothetical protein MBOVJF4428_00480 [Mycoplasmopsis agalactiae]